MSGHHRFNVLCLLGIQVSVSLSLNTFIIISCHLYSLLAVVIVCVIPTSIQVLPDTIQYPMGYRKWDTVRHWFKQLCLFHRAIIFTLQSTPLLWTFTILRMRVIVLFVHKVNSANHDDPPTLSFVIVYYTIIWSACFTSISPSVKNRFSWNFVQEIFKSCPNIGKKFVKLYK